MITLLFANILVRKLDPSTIWYLVAIELIFDALGASILVGLVMS
jgi:hypothetical protein